MEYWRPPHGVPTRRDQGARSYPHTRPGRMARSCPATRSSTRPRGSRPRHRSAERPGIDPRMWARWPQRSRGPSDSIIPRAELIWRRGRDWMSSRIVRASFFVSSSVGPGRSVTSAGRSASELSIGGGLIVWCGPGASSRSESVGAASVKRPARSGFLGRLHHGDSPPVGTDLTGIAEGRRDDQLRDASEIYAVRVEQRLGFLRFNRWAIRSRAAAKRRKVSRERKRRSGLLATTESQSRLTSGGYPIRVTSSIRTRGRSKDRPRDG